MILSDVIEHSPEWHAVRLRNVGGSEIAGLFSVQADYAQSAFTMFMVKSGRIPAPPVDDAPGSRIWFGTRLEPAIAAMAAELHGWNLVKGGYCLSDTTPGQACSLDYIITEPGPEEIKLGFKGPGVLQLKNIDMIQHKQKWTEDEPPFPVLLQLQHEIDCANCTWGAIVGMVGGNQLPAYRYAARERTIMLIRERVTEFWGRVHAGKPPMVDGSESTEEALAALYPTLMEDLPVDLSTDNEMPEICAGLIVATADRKGAEANEQAYKSRLREKMAGRKRAICNGYALNGVFTPANPGTRAGDFDPDKIIGERKEVLWWKVKELAA
jgi:predicted phage-related endonuclease